MNALLLAAVEDEELQTGPIGLVIVLLLLIATALLIRNMNSRIKRLPREFPAQDDESGEQEREPRR